MRYEAVNAMLLNEFLKEHRTVQKQQKEIEALKGELKEQRRQRSGISRIRRVCIRLDSLIFATAAYRPSHQLRTAKRELPVGIALLPD